MIIITEVILSSENIFFWGGGAERPCSFKCPCHASAIPPPPNEGPPVTRLVSSHPLRYLCPD